VVIVLANRKIIINHDFLKNPLMEDACHVYSILVDLEVRENGLYSVVFLCQARNGAQKIAISNSPLKDVM